MEPTLLLMLPLWYAAFLLSLTCHEAAHAVVARFGGDETAYLSGQVTLNPLPHVRREPVGTVLLPLLSYTVLTPGWMLGWASAPYDPNWEERHPRRAAAMAAAGPAANLVLMALALVALRAGLLGGLWNIPEAGIALDRLVAPEAAGPAMIEGLGRLLSVVFVLNLILFLLNILPVPPLDGAAIAAGLIRPLRRPYLEMRGTWLGAIAGFAVATLVLNKLFAPVFRTLVSEFLYAG